MAPNNPILPEVFMAGAYHAGVYPLMQQANAHIGRSQMAAQFQNGWQHFSITGTMRA